MAIGTPKLVEAVEKARGRAAELDGDLGALARSVRDAKPEALDDPAGRRARRQFLESLYDESRDAEKAFERIIGGNELQGANFLLRGALVARTVFRVVIRNPRGRLLGFGSGFLVGDGVLMTNNHVLPSSDIAKNSEAEAFYELGLLGEEARTERFALEPQKLFYTSKELDFSLVAVAPRATGSGEELARIGWMPLVATPGKAMEGEWLTIIQHPKGERKQLCVRENQLIKRDTDVLWYSTDTLGGASGSPVTNNDWLLVALHHSGVPNTKNGKWQTVDGRDYDPDRDDETDIDWIANEGIRVSRIVETLRTDNSIASHPMVVGLLNCGVDDVRARLPVLFRDGAAPPNLLRAGVPAAGAPNPGTRPSTEANMAQRLITVTLAVDDDGNVSIRDQGGAEASLLAEAAAPKKKLVVDAPVEPEKDWIGGYDPGFLGPDVPAVNLPAVGPRFAGQIAELLRKSVYGQPAPDAATAAAGVLNYRNYSVVMHKDRRVAFFSAANIDGGVEFSGLSRPTDRWLFDDRIERKHQIGNDFYAKNKIDRGHLTRREDLEWGVDPVDATRRANGTCTWPNCSPQHEQFNQDKHPDRAIRLWQGLERYILEQTARQYRFKVQSFTGPVFGEFDPEYRGVKIPLDYWKVVVAVDANDKLFATGYVLSQRDVLDVTKLDEAALEMPFGKFETYQRPLAEIEEATGLVFTDGNGQSLSLVDPLAKELAKPVWRRRSPGQAHGGGTQESFAADRLGNEPLDSFDQIMLG